MEGIESEGKTVAEAVENALRRLGLRRDQVEVEILAEGSAGFMGIGARPARVRLVEKRWGDAPAPPSAPPRRSEPRPQRQSAPPPPRRHAPAPAPARASAPAPQPREERDAEPAKPVDPAAACAEAQKRLTETLGLMGLGGTKAAAAWDKVQERVRATVEGADAELLVGSDGRTLESLQFLVTLMVGRAVGTPVAVQVDALGYWAKKEGEIMAEAKKAVETVKASGKPVRLSPMDATMRRLIHRQLAEDPEIMTASEGEGTWRKVVIKPRKG